VATAQERAEQARTTTAPWPLIDAPMWSRQRGTVNVTPVRLDQVRRQWRTLAYIVLFALLLVLPATSRSLRAVTAWRPQRESWPVWRIVVVIAAALSPNREDAASALMTLQFSGEHVPVSGEHVPEAAASRFTYDVFVAHAAATTDEAFVNGYLLSNLGLAPERVLRLQTLELAQFIAEEIERGVRSSRVTVVVLSAAYMDDHWAGFGEQLAAYASVAKDVHGVLLPLLLEDCKLTMHVRSLVKLDFRDPSRASWEAEIDRLRGYLDRPQLRSRTWLARIPACGRSPRATPVGSSAARPRSTTSCTGCATASAAAHSRRRGLAALPRAKLPTRRAAGRTARRSARRRRERAHHRGRSVADAACTRYLGASGHRSARGAICDEISVSRPVMPNWA
jgi:hypothetical protein